MKHNINRRHGHLCVCFFLVATSARSNQGLHLHQSAAISLTSISVPFHARRSTSHGLEQIIALSLASRSSRIELTLLSCAGAADCASSCREAGASARGGQEGHRGGLYAAPHGSLHRACGAVQPAASAPACFPQAQGVLI